MVEHRVLALDWSSEVLQQHQPKMVTGGPGALLQLCRLGPH